MASVKGLLLLLLHGIVHGLVRGARHLGGW